MACHVQEELFDTHIRGTHPGLEHRRHQGAERLDSNRALSEHHVCRMRQRAISHGLVFIAHAAGMSDVRLGTEYIGYVLDDDATGVA